MTWITAMIRRLQEWVATPQLLALIVVVDIAGYFAGLLYWYGNVMSNPKTPVYVWPFIPDCPLFGLLGGIGLLMVIAQRAWSPEAQARGQRWMWIAAALSFVVWLSTQIPALSTGWHKQSAMLAVWTLALLLGAAFFRRAPAWLVTIFAFGQIKYGIWTISAWLLFWQNTAKVFGAPVFTFDSVLMTVTHIGLTAHGVLLLTYLVPEWKGALAGLAWFGLSDYVDYGWGWYPAVPPMWIPISVLQWSTIAVTIALCVIYLLLSRSRVGALAPAVSYTSRI